MNYPIKILPNPKYKKIDCDLSNHHLVRYIENADENELMIPETGQININYVCSPRENISDLSTSLLGIFELKDIHIKLTEKGLHKYNHYCEPNTDAKVPKLGSEYVLDSKRKFWTILIAFINGQKVDYTKSNDSFTAVCHVVHTPMLWNYWHFSIRWVIDETYLHQHLDFHNKKKWTQRLCSNARALISKFASIAEPNYFELDIDCFINQS